MRITELVIVPGHHNITLEKIKVEIKSVYGKKLRKICVEIIQNTLIVVILMPLYNAATGKVYNMPKHLP